MARFLGADLAGGPALKGQALSPSGDHVIPLSKGGHHTASNVVPACGPCNSVKSDGPAPPFVIEPAA